LKAFPLYEGSYSVDASKKFIPFDPATDVASSRKGSLFVHIYPFLIETGSELILLDTGLGICSESGEPWIYQNIRSLGYEPADVSKVILSHLHKDHSLGLVRTESGRFVLNFPLADHYIQAGELLAAIRDELSGYPRAEIAFVQRQSRLVLLEGQGPIGSGVRYEVSGGHVPYHQVIYIEDGSDCYFFGGDELPEGSALIHNYVAKYDFDGRRSRDLRIRYGMCAAEEGWTCLFYHDNESRPVSGVGVNADGSFRIIPT